MMITGRESKRLTKPSLKLGNIYLECSDEYLYLGLVLNKTGARAEFHQITFMYETIIKACEVTPDT